jgi:hypothetical protein
MFRKRDERTDEVREERVEAVDEDARTQRRRDRARGLTRGVATLLGAAAAGLLIWLASQVNGDSTGGYWAEYALLAAAGLALAFSQILGGWTKWGWPRVSAGVFLLGFVPALVAGGWLLLGHQPADNWFRTHVLNWSNDAGVDGLVADLRDYVPVVAFGLGLLFGFTFDTTGPRVREATVAERRRRDVEPVPVEDREAADEPVAAERRTAPATATDTEDEPDTGRRLFGRRKRVETDGETAVAERPPARGTDDD